MRIIICMNHKKKKNGVMTIIRVKKRNKIRKTITRTETDIEARVN